MIITKCGNGYTNREWAEMMKNWDNEIAQINDYLDAVEKIKEIAGKKLVIAGITNNERKAYTMAHRIYNDAEITFTSEKNRQIVEEINEWMTAQERKI